MVGSRSLLIAAFLFLAGAESGRGDERREDFEAQVDARRREKHMSEGGGERSAEEEGRLLCQAKPGERASAIVGALRDISELARSRDGNGGDLKLGRVVRCSLPFALNDDGWGRSEWGGTIGGSRGTEGGSKKGCDKSKEGDV